MVQNETQISGAASAGSPAKPIPHCVIFTAARQAIWRFCFPNSGGKIFSEAEMNYPRLWLFKKSNVDILTFARAACLRRHELAAVKPEQIRQNADRSMTIFGVRGKVTGYCRTAR